MRKKWILPTQQGVWIKTKELRERDPTTLAVKNLIIILKITAGLHQEKDKVQIKNLTQHIKLYESFANKFYLLFQIFYTLGQNHKTFLCYKPS